MKLLFVTMHASPAYLEAALTAGATGYVLTSAVRDELLAAVESVLNGQIYLTPGLSGEQLERFHDPARAAASLRLTARQANRRDSENLEVASHRENINAKLGVRTTTELTQHGSNKG